MLEAYRAHVAERAALGIPPLPLSKQQTTELVALLKNPPAGEEAALVELITYRVPAGVDDAAKVKATELLGTMLGGYNVKPLIDLLASAECGAAAAEGLKVVRHRADGEPAGGLSAPQADTRTRS